MRAAAVFQPRLVPQPFRLAECGNSRAFATTHWVVTEDGKIQQQVDSPMNLKHPHDLVILMRQETTVNYLKELEKQLVAQKNSHRRE